MRPINPKKVFFIKLGPGDRWCKECIDNRTIKIGFTEIGVRDIEQERWNEIKKYYSEREGVSVQTASLYANQIKNFFLADEQTLWITFFDQKLWWCMAQKPIYENRDKTKYKKTVSGWWSKDIKGSELFLNNLSGALTAIQGFRSAICKVRDSSYVIDKINANESRGVKTVEKDLNNLAMSVGMLIKDLRTEDFELLIDLIFRAMGCQRVGIVGGTQKTIDIELFSPVIGERYLVQVKTKTNFNEFQKYQQRFFEHVSYDKYYYIYHTTEDKKLIDYNTDSTTPVVIWRLDDITKHTINAGLIPWLINKTG